LKRREGAKNEETIQALYENWMKLATQVLPGETNYFHKRLEAKELFNKIAFAQSYVRRNQEVRHFLHLKKAATIVSSRYKGRLTRQKMSASDRQLCYKSMLALRISFERLIGKKMRRKDSLDREYLRDYINCDAHPAFKAILTDAQERDMWFAGETLKVNEKSKAQPRFLLIGNSYLHNVKGQKSGKIKERRKIPIASLKSLSLSPFHDNYLFIHVHCKDGADLMYEVDQKTEVVLLLQKLYKEVTKKELRVDVSENIEFDATKETPLWSGQRNLIKFVQDPQSKSTTLIKIDKCNAQVTVGTKYMRG